MHILIVGPTSAPVFERVVSSLHSLTMQADLTESPSLSEAAVEPSADLVLILQSWPDEFTRTEMLAVIDRHPLARLVVCYGPWCDSDGRTRDVWPHAVRVCVSEAPARLRQEIEDVIRSLQPLPLTANRIETYEHRLPAEQSSTHSSKQICVISPDYALCELFRDVLEGAGHTVNESVEPSCDLILWDADPWTPDGRERLAGLLPQCVGIPLVAMCGFPRDHEVRELLSLGVSRVLPKAISNETLLEDIDAVCHPSPPSSPSLTGSLRVHEAG